MNKRFSKFSLRLHPTKTKVIKFGRFARMHAERDKTGKPETFDFLGFTHICSFQFSNGKFKLLRISVKSRFRRKLKSIKDWLTRNMHIPVPDQGRYLRKVLDGWLNYHAIPGNNKAISRFVYYIGEIWFRCLRKRSHKARNLKWDKMNKYIDKWFPEVTIRHPYPEIRFTST